jgi:hypothetical protein
VERSFEEREAGIGKSEADGTTKAARNCKVENLHSWTLQRSESRIKMEMLLDNE